MARAPEPPFEASTLAVTPLTPERWPDLERVFGTNGACGGCWCMYWRWPRKRLSDNKGDKARLAFRAVVEGGPPPGLLAYADEEPVAWVQVGPRAGHPTLERSRILAPVDGSAVFVITCFVTRKGFRRRGLMRPLIEAAKSFARSAGADILEAYPVDDAKEMSGMMLFTGRASTFFNAGFVEVARRSAKRPIVRYSLT